MRSRSKERRRSVDRGTYGPGIQPRKNSLRDADAVRRSGRLHTEHRYREVLLGPARSETPCTYGNITPGNREIPCPPWAAVALEGLRSSLLLRALASTSGLTDTTTSIRYSLCGTKGSG